MNNWYVVVAIVALIAVVVFAVIKFWDMSTDQKIDCIKEWLKWAVVQAEAELGEKTGALKLRMVYDMAVSKFPWIEEAVPFDTFELWVDEALVWMEKQLESNAAVKKMVEGK